MKERTDSYVGTFLNTKEGVEDYKRHISRLREFIKGGRFKRMYRGNKRKVTREFINYKGKLVKFRSGCSVKQGATHFDVYLYDNRDKNGKSISPTFNLRNLVFKY
jgi:hypothetical protein